jgi:hypothetical protein
MSGPAPAPATFYRPAEVAALLHCSEWWVKEQARRRRIPYCWIGGSYRFTDEHVAEMARLFEVRPTEKSGSVGQLSTAARQRSGRADATEAAATLVARLPRRMRDAGMHTRSAA